jgi:hypothetical protein
MAPGKRTLTMGLAARPSAPAMQRKPGGNASRQPSDGRPVEDWMAVALRPDLHQQPILRKSAGEIGFAGASPAPVSGGGKSMPAAVQAKMERAFGADLSGVRIHEGSQATAVGALAYTQGTDIHFAPGQYDPGSQRGQELLGHELAHVVQQSRGGVSATMQVEGVGVNADAGLEREADEMGARAARGELAGSPTGGAGTGAAAVQRRAANGVIQCRALMQPQRLASLFSDNLPKVKIQQYLQGHVAGCIATNERIKVATLLENLDNDRRWHEVQDTWSTRWQAFLDYIDGDPSTFTESEIRRLYDAADNAFWNALFQFTNKEGGWKRPEDERRYPLRRPGEVHGLANPSSAHGFHNRRNELPRERGGYYTSSDLPNVSSHGTTRGARRVLEGQNGETYYTDDHYKSWVRVVGDGARAPFDFPE